MTTAGKDLNRDPITGAPGAHPVGTGVGGLSGAAVGAAVGSVLGPIGMLVGGAVGTIAGAAAGKGVAERMDPTGEVEHWRNDYVTRPYTDTQLDYDRDYAPAYKYGSDARSEHPGQEWDDRLEQRLEQGWSKVKGESRMAWEKARSAVHDAWTRSDRTYRTYDATDRYYADHFSKADYYNNQYSYDDYRPAYRYGTYARSQSASGQWNDSTEGDLEQGWEKAKGTSRMAWSEARNAVRDAWHGVERILPGDADHDGR